MAAYREAKDAPMSGLLWRPISLALGLTSEDAEENLPKALARCGLRVRWYSVPNMGSDRRRTCRFQGDCELRGSRISNKAG